MKMNTYLYVLHASINGQVTSFNCLITPQYVRTKLDQNVQMSQLLNYISYVYVINCFNNCMPLYI